jgi:hypothetical protein
MIPLHDPLLHDKFFPMTPLRSIEVLVEFNIEDVQFSHLSLNPKYCII